MNTNKNKVEKDFESICGRLSHLFLEAFLDSSDRLSRLGI